MFRENGDQLSKRPWPAYAIKTPTAPNTTAKPATPIAPLEAAALSAGLAVSEAPADDEDGDEAAPAPADLPPVTEEADGDGSAVAALEMLAAAAALMVARHASLAVVDDLTSRHLVRGESG